MIKNIDEMEYCPAMPKNPKARGILIIGSGEIVKDAQLPAYKLAGFPIFGIYNRTIDKAEALAKEFNIPRVYDDLDKAIEEASAAGCVYDIALPAQLFIPVLKKLPKGSGVLIQKPMGEDIESAKAILDICSENNLTAGINLQLRQAPYMIQVRKMLEDNVIGEVYDIDWRVVTLQPWSLWTFLEDKERCEINYHSIHYIDAVRSLFGDPEGVYCKTMMSPKSPKLTQTASTIILDYGKSLRCNISTNHAHDFAPDYQESCMKIEGMKGAIRLTIGLILDYPEGRPDKLEYITDDMKEWKEIPLVGSWFPEAFIGTMGGMLRKMEDPQFDYMNSVEDAYKTMCVVEACYESNKHGEEKIKY
jgi:predicted dehydrogenase